MKKQILVLAGSALILASCGSNNNDQQSEQARMDSIANANATLQDEINRQKNDSTINAMAAAKADSMAKMTTESETKTKTKTKANGTSKTTTTTKSTETTTVPTPKAATTQETKFENRVKDTKTMTTEQQKAQDDKFNRRK